MPWKPVAAGLAVAAAGMALGDFIAAGLYVSYQALVARAPGVTFSAEQLTQCLNTSGGVLAAGLVVEGLLTTLGGFATARMAGEEDVRDSIKLLAVLCELMAVALVYASGVSAPTWYYVLSFLCPLPLALLGGGLAYAFADGVGYACAETVPPRPAHTAPPKIVRRSRPAGARPESQE